MSLKPASLSEKSLNNSTLEKNEKIGNLKNKRVVEAKNQTSKVWFILAIVVGAVVVIGVGGFGSVGLLHSHGIISLPQTLQWLASAIGTIGQTPHFWSLWAVTAGGIVMGGGLIAFGSFKIYQARQNALSETKHQKNMFEFNKLHPPKPFTHIGKAKEAEDLLKPQNHSGLKPELKYLMRTTDDLSPALRSQKRITAEELALDPTVVARVTKLNVFAKEIAELLERFGNHFASIGVNQQDFEKLADATYSTSVLGHWEGEGPDKKFIHEERLDRNFIVLRIEDTLGCTHRITQEQEDRIVDLLNKVGATHS